MKRATAAVLAAPASLPRWLMPLCALALLPLLAAALWSDSVDLAHHYALVARLAHYWTLPSAADPSLGEMSLYPRGAHLLAAVLARLAGSPLLGMQLAACGALLVLWCALLAILRALPPRAALLSGATLAVLILANRAGLGAELHGAELYTNYFFSQLVGQALAAVTVLALLWLERRQVPAWWRYGVLAGAAWLCVAIHLLPALELLAVLPLLALAEWRPPLRRRHVLPWLLLAAAALLVWRHPSFAVMQSISSHNGMLPTTFLSGRGALGAYAAALALLSSLLIWRWRRLAQGAAAPALKYLGVLGLAIALLCLAQLGALLLGLGSDYATQKYVFGLNSLMLLELALLPAMLAGWLQPADQPASTAAAHSASPLLSLLLWPLLLALLTLSIRPASAPIATAHLVRLEHQLSLLRDLALPASDQRYTYVSGVPGLSPTQAYLMTIGVFGTPRNAGAGEVLAGAAPSDLRSVSSWLTGPAAAAAAPASCRRASAAGGLAVLDGECLDHWQFPPGSRIGLRSADGASACTLQGFSPAELYGRWSDGPRARITCPLPDLHGHAPSGLRLSAQAFLDHVPLQRLTLRVNGAAARQFQFDSPAPRQLDLPLAADGARQVTLTLELPDARSPQSLGLNNDGRQLGILLSRIEFH